MWTFLNELWPIVATVAYCVAAIAASIHVILYKRDSRSAIAWVGLIWLAPILGSIFYVLLGINRIRRRGQKLRGTGPRLDEPFAQEERPAGAYPPGTSEAKSHPPDAHPLSPATQLFPHHPGVVGLARLAGRLTERPLKPGNRVEPLVGGDQAQPAMLEAIRGARRSVSLLTYIFDCDRVGREFLEALKGAAERGVEVRVLVDDVGSRYSRPNMVGQLSSARVRAERFLQTRIPRLFHYANLRNHRKILVVDGRVGFTGGMNVREGHRLSLAPKHPVEDVHFRLTGPVVADFQETFAVDWEFTTGETLKGDAWFPPLAPDGPVWARGIADGPDEDFETLRLVMLGAIGAATKKISVATPYFLPDAAFITALNVAALRGVAVHILLPERGNLRVVQWASTAQLWQLLERGCRIWLSPPPFDHTKLLIVDGIWTLLGSSNWDPRSLRLNFEFNVECYDASLAQTLTRLVESRMERAREIRYDDVEARSLPVRLRDGVARLLSPFL